MEKLFYNLYEVQDMFGMSKYQIDTYRKKGHLKAIPKKRPLIFPKSEVERLAQQIEDDINKNQEKDF